MKCMEEVSRVIHGFCGEFWDNMLCIYAKEHNGIYIFDMISREHSAVLARESFSCSKDSLSHGSIKYENNIYFLTGAACNILKFSLTTKRKAEIFIQKESLSNTSDIFTVNPVIYCDQLYLFPVDYTKKIPCISLADDKVNYVVPEGWSRLPVYEQAPRFGYFYGCAQYNEFVYRACKFGPYIQKYNLVIDKAEYIMVNGFEGTLRTVAHDGKYLWLLPDFSRRILKWHEEGNQILEVIDLDNYLARPTGYIQAINFCDNYLYISFSQSNEIVKVHLEETGNERVCCVDCNNIAGFSCNGGAPFTDVVKKDAAGNVCFLPNNANGAVIWRHDGTISFFETSISSSEILYALQPKLDFSESMCSVAHFLTENGGNVKEKSKMIGETIWDKIRDM